MKLQEGRFIQGLRNMFSLRWDMADPDEFLEVSGQVGAEKEFLHQIERKVEKPFRYEWVEGWSTLLGSMVADLGVVMALFLGIVLSSLFAGEWHDNTSTLVLTTRNGWGKNRN